MTLHLYSERLAALWRAIFRMRLSIKDIAHYVQPASPRQKVNCHNSILTFPRLRCLGLRRVSLSEAVSRYQPEKLKNHFFYLKYLKEYL